MIVHYNPKNKIKEKKKPKITLNKIFYGNNKNKKNNKKYK